MLDAAVAVLVLAGFVCGAYLVGCYLSDLLAERIFGRYK